MWKNILIIFIIILFSYIFTLKDKNYFDLQILFIVLSIAILIIYKLMFVSNLNKTENFGIEHENVNDFFQGNTTTSVSNSDKDADIERIKGQLEVLKSAVDVNNTQNTGKNLLKEDLAYKNQENDINLLENKVEELKEYLYLSNEEKNETFYKKIPVYNSCKSSDNKIKETTSEICTDNKTVEECKAQSCEWKNQKCKNWDISPVFDQQKFIKDLLTSFAQNENTDFKLNLS